MWQAWEMKTRFLRQGERGPSSLCLLANVDRKEKKTKKKNIVSVSSDTLPGGTIGPWTSVTRIKGARPLGDIGGDSNITAASFSLAVL